MKRTETHRACCCEWNACRTSVYSCACQVITDILIAYFSQRYSQHSYVINVVYFRGCCPSAIFQVHVGYQLWCTGMGTGRPHEAYTGPPVRLFTRFLGQWVWERRQCISDTRRTWQRLQLVRYPTDWCRKDVLLQSGDSHPYTDCTQPVPRATGARCTLSSSVLHVLLWREVV